MAFDSLNMFHDGTTITADITPTSETRASGSAVLAIYETPAKGSAVVLLVGAEPTGTTPTCQVSIEDCATVDGTYRERARFPLLTGASQAGIYVVRFDSDRQFVRCKIDVEGTTPSYTSLYLFLCPPAFKTI